MIITKHSKWLGRRDKKQVIYEVVGIWATGTGPNYRPVSYELKPETGGDIVTIPRENMVSLIETGKFKSI